ncbi:MAG: hypothetical protein PHP68_06230, partial [Oscillospiraceae bacterium]|nr:hypothetical protein [Oscillospiraceae bacterium]
MKKGKLLCFLALSITLLFLFINSAIAAQISLISYDTADWVSLDAVMGYRKSQATLRLSDGALIFDNTNGLWPCMEYNLKDGRSFNVECDRIVYDFTPGKRTRIHILFYDTAGIKQAINISPAIQGVMIDEGEICAMNHPISGELSLKGLEVLSSDAGVSKMTEDYADENGNIRVAGVGIYIITNLEGAVEIRNLAFSGAEDETTTLSSSSITTLPSSTTTPSSSPTSLPAQSVAAPQSVAPPKQTVTSSSLVMPIDKETVAQAPPSVGLVAPSQIAETDSITPKESAALLVNTGSDGRLNHIAYRYAPLIMLIFS